MSAPHYIKLASFRLMRGGVILLLLSLATGFIVHAATLKYVTIAAHVVGIIGSGMLITCGSAWQKMTLSPAFSCAGYVLGLYGFYSSWIAYLFAGVSGAGGMFSLASEGIRGSLANEMCVSVLAMSGALSLVGFCCIMLFGLKRQKKYKV